MKKIPIAHPLIGDEEKRAVMEVLDSGMLVQGTVVQAFEEAFAAYSGVKHAIATTNGTTALQAALYAHGVGPADEVIVPSFSFIATATSVLSTGARPVFVDIEPDTFNMSPTATEAAITPRTKAIMPVHLYGHPADMNAFSALAEKHGLILLEDAAQAHGAMLNGRKVGSWGTAAFSFYASKNITTGEGGMITTNDTDVARWARMVRNHGMSQQYFHAFLGFNFRMTNLVAAIGIEQLKHLEDWTARRIANAAFLTEKLKTVTKPTVRPGVRHVYHQYTVRAPQGADRDAMVKQLNKRGIGARVYYPLPVHRQPVFQSLGYKVDLPETENAVGQVFSLPVHPALGQEDLERIAAEVNVL
jgi:perosamine synthetase